MPRLNVFKCPRGGTCLVDGRGSAARFSESYPLLITDSCRHTHSYDEFSPKTTHFWQFFANFWKTHPCLRKICRKRGPCLENFGPKNPSIWAAHTRTIDMLCYPPPLPSGKCHSEHLDCRYNKYELWLFLAHVWSMHLKPWIFMSSFHMPIYYEILLSENSFCLREYSPIFRCFLPNQSRHNPSLNLLKILIV